MVARGTPARLLFSAFLALPWAVPGQGDPTAGQADPTAAIHGVVVDAETGAPVVGAEVVVSGGPSTLTGENGAWRLEDVSAGERLVHVSHIGYGAERVEVRVPTDAPVRVVLEPRAIPLDAVVVTGSRR
ncbi:MAG TPA: carboxypeptidase-like regulatory domain-containing protein, partial [Longimicrobiales bacterium]|nr:carboxypeptidase-like regulatory domain-containing protein [Longimicrobiales bacterium]